MLARLRSNWIVGTVIPGLCVIVALAICLKYAVSTNQDSAGRDYSNGIVIDEDDLDLGFHWEQAGNIKTTMPIQNAGRSPLRVDDIKPSCNCTSLWPKQFVIAPGDKVDISVELSPMSPKPEDDPFLGSRHEVSIGLIGENGSVLSDHALRWTVRRFFSVDPPRLILGAGFVGGPLPSTQVLKVECGRPVKEISCKGERLKVSVSGPLDGESTQYELAVSPVAASVEGPGVSIGKLLLSALCADGETIPAIAIPVAWQLHNRVHPIPSEIVFGILKEGESAAAEFSLKCEECSIEEIEGFSSTSEDATVEQIGTNRFRVTLLAREPKYQSGEVNLKVIADFANEPINVRIDYGAYVMPDEEKVGI